VGQPSSYNDLDRIGRIRLSDNFFMRDFLYSEIAIHYGIPNTPDDELLAVEVGSALCEHLLEPLQLRFGRLHIRSAFRSSTVNETGNTNGHNCSRNAENYAGHIWDRKDDEGRKGATACIVVPGFADCFDQTGDWTELAWWIHDNLPYCWLEFFSPNWAFNITWSDQPKREIWTWAHWISDGEIVKNRIFTRRGMPNYEGDHGSEYKRLNKVFSL